MSSAAVNPAGSADTGRKVHFAVLVAFMLLVFVQFYLAGRGAFGAGTYEAHSTVGGIAHLLSLVLLVVAIAVPSTRNRMDIGMAAGLFVLITIQTGIASREHPSLAAFHPFLALLIVGFGFHLVARDRRALGQG